MPKEMNDMLPPHTMTRVEHFDETGLCPKKTVHYWNEAAVKLAVRQALELAARVADDMDCSPDGAIAKQIRAMIEEPDK